MTETMSTDPAATRRVVPPGGRAGPDWGSGAPSPDRRVGGLIATAAIGGVLGALTDAGQSWLPWAASSMANSGGSWVVVTFALAFLAGRVGRAALGGGIAMVALVVGYYLTADQRGVAVAASAVRFWVVAAVVIGPLVGVAAAWVRYGSPDRVAVGAGVLAGLLLGESAYGLLAIRPWTSSAYWCLEAVGGLGLVVGLLAWRGRRWSAVPVTLLTCVAVGVATLGAYLGLL